MHYPTAAVQLRRSRAVRPLGTLLVALLLAGCQAGDGMMQSPTMMPGGTMAPGDGMGLGGSAETTVLAEGVVPQLTAGALVWVAYEPSEDGTIDHIHAPGFVYASEGSHTLTVEGEEMTLAEGEALFLEAGADHTHHDGSFWDITLATLQPDGAPTVQGASAFFTSERLNGIPAPPVRLSFVEVTLPANGGQTAVHTHPGPEFIHVTDGELDYQTALAETEQLSAGDHRALPADTAVQKRNPSSEPARFLSWFAFDPDQPFSSEAEFE